MNETRLRQIRDYLDGARDLSPALIDAEGHVSRGNAHFALREYASALEEFEAAIRQRPDYVNAHFNAGIVLSLMDRHADAMREFEYAISLAQAQDVSLPEAYYHLAMSLRAQGRPQEALSAAVTATERGGDPSFAYLRSELHAALGDRDQALAWLRRAIVTAPRYKSTARQDAAFATLRADAEFNSLVA
jgi:tetratricopeptide (TPR) repeat protein